MHLTKVYLVVFVIIALGCLSNSESSESFTDKGSIWVSGSFGFSTIGIKGYEGRQNVLLITPTVRFFAANFFAVGPRFQLIGLYTENSSANQIGFGMDLAFAYGKKPPVIPYIRTGAQFDIYSYSSTFSSQYLRKDRYSDSQTGFTLPIAVGLIIPALNIFAVQIEPSFQVRWVDDDSMNVFSLSIGFAGVGKKVCVSTLQTLSSFY